MTDRPEPKCATCGAEIVPCDAAASCGGWHHRSSDGSRTAVVAPVAEWNAIKDRQFTDWNKPADVPSVTPNVAEKGVRNDNDCPYHVRLHPDERCTCPPRAPNVTQRQTCVVDEAFLMELDGTLSCVAQLLDGWHADGTAWSEWDESVRKDVSRLHKKVFDLHQAMLLARGGKS